MGETRRSKRNDPLKGDQQKSRGFEDTQQGTEESYRPLSEYMRLLLESTDQGIYGIDLQARCTLVNRAAAAMTGYRPEDILGKNIHELIHHSRPDGSPYPMDECPIIRAIRLGQGVRVDGEVFWRRDGSSFPVEYSSYPIVEGGITEGAVVTFFDITERRRMEDALRNARDELEIRVQERTGELKRVNEDLRAEIASRRKAEEEYATILRSAMDGFWITDTRGRLLDVNEAYSRLIGYSRDELLGMRIQDLEAAETPEETARHTRRVIERGYDRFETRHRRKDGTIVDVEVSVNHLPGDSGRLIAFLRDVTERKRAERALRESEERYRTLAEAAQDSIFLIDRDDRILYVNSFAASQFGKRPEEIVGRSREELFSPFVSAVQERNLRQVFETGEPGYFEDKTTFPGREVWLGTRLAPIRDEDGQVAVVLGIARDITERKLAEQERERLLIEVQRRASEMDAILSSIAEGLIIYDRHGNIVRMNPVAEEILAYSPRERKKPLEERVRRLRVETVEGEPVSPEDTPPARALRGETVRGAVLALHAPEGRATWVSVSAAPLVSTDGNIVGAVATFANVTRMRELQEERERLLALVQQRAAELQSILDNMVDGVFVCDPRGRITLANEAGVRLSGMRRVEEVRRPLVELTELLRVRHLDGRPVPPEEMPLARALRGEVALLEDEVFYNRRTKRDTYVRANAAPIRDERGQVVGAVEVVRDVTEETEFDLLKDQFISVAAHELKTPVAIMKAYAQALLRAGEQVPAPMRKMLDAIDRGSDRIDRIVKDLLDISRLHLGHLELTIETIDIPEMVQEVIDRMALTTTRHRIRLVRAEPVVVQGDRDRLEQVLINMIDNAIKYSPKGGDIDVAVDVRDHEAVVSVRDHGVGIPREKQKHIFERFYRAHTGTPYDYGGMGVGLFISREIVARHGGRMWFESEERKGSTFYFSLPLKGEHRRTRDQENQGGR